VIKHYIKTNLVLNFEMCHFRVGYGIVLDHALSFKGLEVDKAKVDIMQPIHSVSRR